MAFDGMKKFFGVEEETTVTTDGKEEGFYNVSTEQVANKTEMGSNKMILFEPRAYSESTQITDY